MSEANTRNGKSAVAGAALALFAEKGVLATTTRDIARKAGVAEGTIYRHYSSKDSLSRELFRQCVDHLRAYLEESLEQQRSTVGKFRVLVQAFFDYARREPASYSYIMFGHHAQLYSAMQGAPMPKDVFVELIRDGMEKGIFQKRDENMAAAMVIGALSRVIFFKQNGLIAQDYEQIIPETTEACLRMIAPEDVWAAECC